MSHSPPPGDSPFAPRPEPPYYAVVFASQRREGDHGYAAMAAQMMQLAAQQPGYLGVESARGSDGFGLTVSYWATLESIQAWRRHAEHVVARDGGRRDWYEGYELRVSRVERAYGWRRAAGDAADPGADPADSAATAARRAAGFDAAGAPVKLAVLSDIHGNLPALAAVLAEVARERVTAMINLGDILSGPLWPAETADRLMGLDWPTITGNHERQLLLHEGAVLGASDAHAAQRLREPHRAWLATLPPTRWVGRSVFCCHGTPTSDLHYWLETLTPDFDPAAGRYGLRAATPAEILERSGGAAELAGAELMLCGHSHVARCVRLDDGRLVLNPGSVGLPAFDDAHGHPHWVQAGAPHARYALVERGAFGWNVQLRAVAYDWQRAAQQALAHGRSDWADALATGRVGRTEAEVDAAVIAITALPGG